MPSIQFKVPSSSLPELKKIIRGYAHLEKNVSLSALSKLVSIGETTLSPNNPFLTEVGIIADQGRAKNVTPLGKQLGRAIEHNREDEIRRAWQEVIKGNAFMSNLVSTVRIKGGMNESDLASHILFAADLKKNKASSTGANTVIAILKESSFLEENNGKLIVTTSTNPVEAPGGDDSQAAGVNAIDMPSNALTSAIQVSPPVITTSASNIVSPTIAINIQLQLPETENASVYENLFKALRKHLLTPEDKTNA